jgi:hypothetical protein
MRNARRLTVIGFLLCGVLVFAPNSGAQQRAPILDQVAKAYGVGSWDQVEAIRYTWNGEITGLFKAAHKWEWEPKTGKVSFEGVDKDGKPVKVSYVRTDLSSPIRCREERSRPELHQRQLLGSVPISCLLGQECQRDRSGQV